MNEEIVQIPKEQFDRLVTEAAREAGKQGAQEVLGRLGLGDNDAGNDIRDLRELIGSWRSMKKEVLKTTARAITMFVLGALSVGLAIKSGFFKMWG